MGLPKWNKILGVFQSKISGKYKYIILLDVELLYLAQNTPVPYRCKHDITYSCVQNYVKFSGTKS